MLSPNPNIPTLTPTKEATYFNDTYGVVHTRTNNMFCVERFSTVEIKLVGATPLPARFARLAGVALVVIASG